MHVQLFPARPKVSDDPGVGPSARAVTALPVLSAPGIAALLRRVCSEGVSGAARGVPEEGGRLQRSYNGANLPSATFAFFAGLSRRLVLPPPLQASRLLWISLGWVASRAQLDIGDVVFACSSSARSFRGIAQIHRWSARNFL